MESKLNHSELAQYSTAFTQAISQGFFEHNTHASGEQLLEISPIKQVNLFVVMALFQEWKQEFKKLQSPFFDYSSKAVRKGLKEFMNVLSRHISVDEHTLRPLMERAVRQALLLSLSPYDFFASLINSQDHTRVSLSDLKEWRKYIKVNRPLMDGLIARFEERDLKEVFNDEAFRMFNELLETGTYHPEASESFLARFNPVVPVTLDQFWGSTTKKAAPTAMGPLHHNEEEEEAADGVPTLNDQMRTEQRTLADDLQQQQKVSNIKKHITLNQRYMFVGDLFGNDPEAFNQALESVEAQTNLDDALRILVDNYAEPLGWDMESVPVTELLDVISKRYT